MSAFLDDRVGVWAPSDGAMLWTARTAERWPYPLSCFVSAERGTAVLSPVPACGKSRFSR